MKVILIQDIRGLGNKFDIKQVKSGYARNFLIPKNLAKIANERTLKELKRQKNAWEKEEQEIKSKLETLAKSLDGKEFVFSVKTGKKREVFGSVTKEMIAAKIKEVQSPEVSRQYLEIEPPNIDLEKPIKKLGEHRVEIVLQRVQDNPEQRRRIDLGGGIKSSIKVILKPEA